MQLSSYILLVDVILETVRTLSDAGAVEGPPCFFRFRKSSELIHFLAFVLADAASRQIRVSVNRKIYVTV